MGDVLQGDLTELTAQIAAGHVTCEAVMAATIERIDAVNGQVNAIVSLRPRGELMAEAKAADKARRGGANCGLLHGVPLAVKDLAETRDIRTTMGSPIFANHVPEKDAALVARMKAAGGIVIGKTNTPEFGLGSHTYNPVHGATRNPYNLALSAGGSSGGAAAALAARMLMVADGSDMMGSLRNPAAWCNVYGFRPTWGRVPPEPGPDAYLHRLATDGPMARSVRDVAALLRVLVADDRRAPRPIWEDGQTFELLEASVSGRRVAWLGDWGGAYALEAGIREMITDGLATFTDMGVVVEDVGPVHPAGDIWTAWCDLRSFSVAAKLAPHYRTHRQALKPAAIWEIERGLNLSAMDIQRASEARTNWLRRAIDLFGNYDALILPSAQTFAFDVTWEWPHQIGGRQTDSYHRWMEVVVPASILGLPALNVPVGFDANGRAMGMQIIGAPGKDLSVLQLGEAWHQATQWPQRRPPDL